MNAIIQDSNDPYKAFAYQMFTTEIAEKFAVMRRQEETTYKCFDYLIQLQDFTSSYGIDNKRNDEKNCRHSKAEKVPSVVNKECRLRMINWYCEVVDCCHLSNETVAIAISTLDRFLATTKEGLMVLYNRKYFQLVALCSFWIAVKLNEPTKLEISMLTHVSRGYYSLPQFYQTEETILSALQWRMSPPIASNFLEALLELLAQSLHMFYSTSTIDLDVIRHLSKLQVEESVRDYYLFTTQNPSNLAVASIINALSSDEVVLPNTLLQVFMHDIFFVAGIDPSSKSIRDCQNRLREMCRSKLSSALPSATANVIGHPCNKLFDSSQEKLQSSGKSPVCVRKIWELFKK